jgi:hypothetical protein
MKSHLPPQTTVALYFIGVFGTFLIVAGLIGLMYFYTRPAPLDAARAAERRKNLAELNALNQKALENYETIDPVKGIIRLPIARAMELTALEWRDPAVGRSNLLARLERALIQPPPPPNKYE